MSCRAVVTDLVNVSIFLPQSRVLHPASDSQRVSKAWCFKALSLFAGYMRCCALIDVILGSVGSCTPFLDP